ncbi:MAG TPA: PIG-L family deacetylase [Ktedonobacterales bacterium]|nr:PIG-L family deacetylase [Ktedonobacterales bacterium]
MPDTTPLCLMAVHAHPDDECFAGGIFGRYADAGVRTVLVTCTLGEEGEIVDPTMDADAVRPKLAEVRTEELRCSVAALGIAQLHLLGYRDSGMVGTPANAHPLAFTNVDFATASARLVALVRAERPQVIVTYDPQGGYGHPDHIMAHRIAVAAYEGAGDVERFPVAPGEPGPWSPSKLYYVAWPRERLMALRQEVLDRGLPDPFARWASAQAESEQQEQSGEAQPERGFIQPEHKVTTMVAVDPYYERKLASMRCHKTQFTETSNFALSLPPDLSRKAFSQESFVLAQSRVATEPLEDDLFAGVR